MTREPAMHVHFGPQWSFAGTTSDNLDEVTCAACLEHAREQAATPCAGQITRNTATEPGEPCHKTAIPGSEYCEVHAALHGDNEPLGRWETAA